MKYVLPPLHDSLHQIKNFFPFMHDSLLQMKYVLPPLRNSLPQIKNISTSPAQFFTLNKVYFIIPGTILYLR